MKRILSIVLTLALLLTALPLALSVSAAETVWTLVTDVNELNAGDKVVIVAKDYDYALSTTQNKNNRAPVAITKNDNTVTINDSVQILTLETGNVSDTFAFNTGEGYLYAASSGSNYLKTETTLSNNSSWLITIDANGVATIKAQGTNTRNWLRYNKSNSLFACYSSGQEDIFLYVGTETGGGEPETPSCSHTNKSYTPVDNEKHSVVCDDCDEDLGEETHSFTNNLCTKCGAEKVLTSLGLGNINSNTNTYTISAIVSANGGGGAQNDANETYLLNENTQLINVNGYLHSDGTLRVYSDSDIQIISTKAISSITLNMGYKDNNMDIYASADGAEFTLIKSVETTVDYADNTVEMPAGTSYKYIKLDDTGTSQIRIKSFTIVTADETAECTHENTTKTDANVVGATYFVDGSKDVVCECGETVQTGVVIPATAKALSSCVESYADGKLTITLTYTKALLEDIDNGAEIYFNYSIDGFNNSVKIVDKESESLDTETVITLEGFNASRLNSKLTYNLSAVYAGVNTDKLAEEAKGEIEIAKKLDDKTSTFINTLNTAENTVVSGKAASTDEFATNTITADLKAGEMYLNFIASSDLVKKLTENNAYARENKVVVTVDGLSAVELDLPVLRQSTTLKISGMSFEQLYGTVTIKLVFNYPDNTGLNFETAEVVFDGSAAVAATNNSSVANAFAAYMTK